MRRRRDAGPTPDRRRDRWLTWTWTRRNPQGVTLFFANSFSPPHANACFLARVHYLFLLSARKLSAYAFFVHALSDLLKLFSFCTREVPSKLPLTNTTQHTPHYTTLPFTTLYYPTLLYKTLHYATLHYTHDTTPHHTTPHNSTLHYKTLHTLLYMTLHYTTLHYTTFNYITLHYNTLCCIALHRLALRYIHSIH